MRGRLAHVTGALFPCYLFVAPAALGSPSRRWTAPGVRKLVRFGALYLPVCEDVIAALKTREDPDIGCHRSGAPALQPGARVRVDIGPFADLEGILEARAGQDRVVILLDLLGQRARTSLAVGELGT